MANAGRHTDTQLIKHMIKNGKLIKVSPDDSPVAVDIKNRFNDIVLKDTITTYKHDGKKYDSHGAWQFVNRVLIKINQLRLKHRFFNSIPKP